jgi:ribosome biogenesis GTPase
MTYPNTAEHASSEVGQSAATYRVSADFGKRIMVSPRTTCEQSELELICHRMAPGELAVGDWVVATPVSDRAVELVSVIERTSAFCRLVTPGRRQILAANIDRLFIVTSCTPEFNLSRLERYLLLARANRIEPVILLNKSDLEEVHASYDARLNELGGDYRRVRSCAVRGEGMDELRTLIPPGITAAFVGSSGVGKSSIVNALLNVDLQKTSAVSANGARGAHTTTNRSLFTIPRGGMVIDTPGIRSVGISGDEGSFQATFEDIFLLMEDCEFRNCGHTSEDGCEVRLAISEGRLSDRRFKSFNKLRRELAFQDDPDGARSELRNEARRMVSMRNSRRKFERDPR